MTTPLFADSEGPVATLTQESSKLPLGEQLLRAGLVTDTELATALSEHQSKGLRLGEALIDLGFIEEDDLLPVLARQMGIPYARIRESLVDPSAVQLIPREQAEELNVLAMFCVRGELTVAMAEPQNLRILDEIEHITQKRVRPLLASNGAIERLLGRCYEEDFAVDEVTVDVEDDAVELHPDAYELDLRDVQHLGEGSPVVSLVNYILVHAVRKGASDIHIEPGQHSSSIRYRIDGQLHEVLKPRRDFHAAVVSRIKVMARMDIAEQRKPQDGRMHVVVERREIDLRCSTVPTVQGEKVVLRVLDRKNVTFDMEQLGIASAQLTVIKQMLARPHGLVLVTGPTGSGKTTTLYSAIELIKSINSNIVTVENPVEYQLDLVNQIQTGGSTDMSFAHVLRSILRQDPDIIMVGEIRDAETAEIAIQAALTGHLVLSTLHTNDSASAVTRLTDMGIAPYKISAALVGVVAQRLVRTICPACRTTHYPRADYLAMLHYQGDNRRQFSRGEGCDACFDTGLKGRQGIYEVLVADAKFRDLITKEASLPELREAIKEQGGTSLLDEGIALAEAGETSLDEIVRVALFD